MKKLKVMTVVGTRPEIIKLSLVIEKLTKSDAIDHVLVHTGQNYDYELNEMFFSELGLAKPDIYLGAAGDSASQTIGLVLMKIDPILDRINPDALLILGDTNSCLCAIAAKKRKVPIFHMEAGNRCYDQRVPEEINRKIVDHISDINLTYSDIAREYLLREGLPADRIIKTGSPMFEVLNHNMSKIRTSGIMAELNLRAYKYFVVSAHREENVNSDQNFLCLIETLNSIAEEYQCPVIFSTHPRTRGIIESKKVVFHQLIRLLRPLSFSSYNQLQIHSTAVLSDSGTISEESSILNFPALNIRQAHERPEAMEEGAVMMVGLEKERIMQGLKLLENQFRSEERNLQIVTDYSKPNVSEKVLRIILSYTDYVKRVVWQDNVSRSNA